VRGERKKESVLGSHPGRLLILPLAEVRANAYHHGEKNQMHSLCQRSKKMQALPVVIAAQQVTFFSLIFV
jgi:hypothetical protein